MAHPGGMAENDDPTPEPADETVQQPAVSEPAAAAPVPVAPAGPRFTERLWNFRAMVAVALAALLLGGGLGAAITAASHDDRQERRAGFDRWGGGGPGPYFAPGGPGGFGPGDRQQLRDDLKKMRKDMRDQMRQRLQDDKGAPTPTTPPTPPPPSASSNG